MWVHVTRLVFITSWAFNFLLPRSVLRRSVILCGHVLLCASLGAELPDHIEIFTFLDVHCFFC